MQSATRVFNFYHGIATLFKVDKKKPCMSQVGDGIFLQKIQQISSLIVNVNVTQ